MRKLRNTTRKLTLTNFLRRKINYDKWVSASDTKNFMMDDTFSDWVKYSRCGSSRFNFKSKATTLSLSERVIDDIVDSYIVDRGNLFEDIIIGEIKAKFKDDVVTISDVNREERYNNGMKYYEQTVQAIKDSIPIIYQGVLYNFKNKTYGTPDLIIRSDYINKLVNTPTLPQPYEKICCNLNPNYHYRVIDIKSSQLKLCSDSIHLTNGDNYKFYKMQVYVYTKALMEIGAYPLIDGIDITGYILGSSWSYTKKRVKHVSKPIFKKYYNPFDRLGCINYSNKDAWVTKSLDDALYWISDVRKNGHKWDVYPSPSRPEMFPNMKNKLCSGYAMKAKQEVASKIKELTSIFYVGVDNRNLAISSGITRWDDPRCNAKLLGFKDGGHINKIVDQILRVNREPDEYILPKTQIKTLPKSTSHVFDFFVDFETINKVMIPFDQTNIYDDVVFMIGVVYRGSNNEIHHHTFVVDDLTKQSETEMFSRFNDYIRDVLEIYKKTSHRIFHYGNHEKTYSNRANTDYLEFVSQDKWFDLYSNVIYREPVAIKGALNLKLKSIGKAMFDLGYITTNWDSDETVDNGFSAMEQAVKYYIHKDQTVNFSDIIKYNQIDCQVLMEITEYLRRH